jgi:hypothetical protein
MADKQDDTAVETTLSVSVPDVVEAAALIMYRRDPSVGPTATTWYDLTDEGRDIWVKRALHALSGLAAAGYKVVRA